MLAAFNSKRNQSAMKEFQCYGGTLFVGIEQLDEMYFACKFPKLYFKKQAPNSLHR